MLRLAQIVANWSSSRSVGRWSERMPRAQVCALDVSEVNKEDRVPAVQRECARAGRDGDSSEGPAERSAATTDRFIGSERERKERDHRP